MGVVIVEREGTVLGMNLGHPTVTNEDIVVYCTEVHESIELSFGVVSGVSRGMGVLDGCPSVPRKGEFWEWEV